MAGWFWFSWWNPVNRSVAVHVVAQEQEQQHCGAITGFLNYC
jgi:hypothetical protein